MQKRGNPFENNKNEENVGQLINKLGKLFLFRVIPVINFKGTYLSYNIFWHSWWKKSGEDEGERKILMKSGILRFLDFIKIILSYSSLI